MADNDGITEVDAFSQEAVDFLTNIASNFSLADAQAVKEIERTTNHVFCICLSNTLRPSISIRACDKLLISSEVQAKWKNSLTAFNSALPL
jgi:hypothetical protein